MNRKEEEVLVRPSMGDTDPSANAPSHAPRAAEPTHSTLDEAGTDQDASSERGAFRPGGRPERPVDRRRPPDIDTTGGPPAGMSKNQWKKQLRQEKAQAEKKERRAAEKQRRKANKRARYQEMQAKIEAGEMEAPEPKRQKPNPLPKIPLNVGVIIDLGFDSLMDDKERRSMCLQLGHLYSTQRKSTRPFKYLYYVGEGKQPGQAYVDSAGPSPKAEEHDPENLLDTALGKHMENNWGAMWRRWKFLSILPKGGIEALIAPSEEEEGTSVSAPRELEFLQPHDIPTGSKKISPESQHLRTQHWKKEDLIYLTADSTETVGSLEEGKTYIVGGIVDRNRYKNLCANKAHAMGIRTARLPIDAQTLRLADGAELTARKVLTVNQVFDILSGWAETQDWPQALARAFPVRKLREVILPGERAGASPAAAVESTQRQDRNNTVKNGADETAVDLHNGEGANENEDLDENEDEEDDEAETGAIQQAAADADSDDDSAFNA